MGAIPMLALGNVELIGVENTLSHGRKKEAQKGRRKLKMTKTTVAYPRFVNIDRNGVSMKVFETSNGNEVE